nr:MAG TPA: hypothetical protein [Crassvirales sp.]
MEEKKLKLKDKIIKGIVYFIFFIFPLLYSLFMMSMCIGREIDSIGR